MIILAEFNFYWQNITSTGRIWLPLAEHGLYWLIVTLAGRIWLILAEYDFHWQNMIYTGLLSLLMAEYTANQKCSAVLLCSADSIYPKKLSTVRDATKHDTIYPQTVVVVVVPSIPSYVTNYDLHSSTARNYELSWITAHRVPPSKVLRPWPCFCLQQQ